MGKVYGSRTYVKIFNFCKLILLFLVMDLKVFLCEKFLKACDLLHFLKILGKTYKEFA